MGDLRVGKVTDINTSERLVRVHFPDVDIVSGWLKVIKSPPFVGGNKSQTETEALHEHKLIITPWLPEIGELVLCLYNTGFNEDGFVIGGL